MSPKHSCRRVQRERNLLRSYAIHGKMEKLLTVLLTVTLAQDFRMDTMVVSQPVSVL